MASPRTHPRRSSPYPRALQFIAIDPKAPSPLALKKGSTFHSPTSPASEHDPILNIPSLPQRSATSLKELEDIVESTPSERIVRLIGAVDRSFSDLQSFAASDNAVADTSLGVDETPVPAFMVTHADQSAEADPMDVDTKHPASAPASPQHVRTHKHHASDSGIGSTVSSEAPVKLAPARPAGQVQTGINGISTMAPSFSAASHHVLGEYACRQIQKHIILPIKREEKLKNFHPLVNGLPYRIARKEITCLRDLEKVLLWLAPVRNNVIPQVSWRSTVQGLIFGAKKWSISKASFLLFCETTIQCLHTAVEHLNEKDQCRPTDRPYTNGYFVDLVEQVRQYAAQLAATRSRMATDERLELVGGLGRTGREAEIVRTKDGRSISLRTGEEVTEEYKQGLKRSSLEIEEELERSMARRRKNAPLEKQIQKCGECDKVFKRPCDLTKHEKTHSRPWKCTEPTCKYHEYGWPTEKERDRHVNDKHSAAPVLFKCRFAPCPYESKRESNCKQHMEKAHGWVYVKSKSNGKNAFKTPSSGPGQTPPTPLDSASSEFTTSPSPQVAPMGYGTPYSHGRHASTEASTMGGSSVVSPDQEFRRMFGTGEPVFGWTENPDDLINDLFGVNVESTRSWNDFSMNNVPTGEFSDMFNEDEPIFGPNFDWSNMDQDLTSMNIQLATPPLSLEPLPAEVLKGMPATALSPQQQAMLYSPYSMHSNEATLDEGYCGDFPQDLVRKPVNDFSLFDANTVSSLNTSTKEAMFEDLSTFGGYARNDFSVDYMAMQE